MNNKLLNRFIGNLDDRDEYQKQEIYKELAFWGVLLWTSTMLLMFASFIADTIRNSLSFITIALLIINMLYAGILTIRLRKNHLDETDCATMEEYEIKKRRLRKSSLLAGSVFGILLIFFNLYLFPYLSSGTIEFSLFTLSVSVITAIGYGMAMYYVAKSKLKKHF